MNTEGLILGGVIGLCAGLASGFLRKAGEDAYLWLKKKIRPLPESSASHIVVHVDRHPTDTEQQSNQAGTIERVWSIPYREIASVLEESPPLQRSTVAQRYVGIRVEWSTTYLGGRDNGDGSLRLQLKPDGAEVGTGSVFCTVPSDEYRTLGVLNKGANIRVTGTIEQFGDYGVNLVDARLDIAEVCR